MDIFRTSCLIFLQLNNDDELCPTSMGFMQDIRDKRDMLQIELADVVDIRKNFFESTYVLGYCRFYRFVRHKELSEFKNHLKDFCWPMLCIVLTGFADMMDGTRTKSEESEANNIYAPCENSLENLMTLPFTWMLTSFDRSDLKRYNLRRMWHSKVLKLALLSLLNMDSSKFLSWVS